MGAPRTVRHYQNDDYMLDADMTTTDIVSILSRLHFGLDRPVQVIGIDAEVRDYLVDALRPKPPRAEQQHRFPVRNSTRRRPRLAGWPPHTPTAPARSPLYGLPKAV
jgi:hypothetical protein